MICLLSHCGRPAFEKQFLHSWYEREAFLSHLVEHELDDEAKSGWIEAHEDQEVNNHSYHSIRGQLLQSRISWSKTIDDEYMMIVITWYSEWAHIDRPEAPCPRSQRCTLVPTVKVSLIGGVPNRTRAWKLPVPSPRQRLLEFVVDVTMSGQTVPSLWPSGCPWRA